MRAGAARQTFNLFFGVNVVFHTRSAFFSFEDILRRISRRISTQTAQKARNANAYSPVSTRLLPQGSHEATASSVDFL